MLDYVPACSDAHRILLGAVCVCVVERGEWTVSWVGVQEWVGVVIIVLFV